MAVWRGPASGGAYHLNRRCQLEAAAETMQYVQAELVVVTAADLTQGPLLMTVVRRATEAPRLERHPVARCLVARSPPATSYPELTTSCNINVSSRLSRSAGN